MAPKRFSFEVVAEDFFDVNQRRSLLLPVVAAAGLRQPSSPSAVHLRFRARAGLHYPPMRSIKESQKE
jgi:hypothetical protein